MKFTFNWFFSDGLGSLRRVFNLVLLAALAAVFCCHVLGLVGTVTGVWFIAKAEDTTRFFLLLQAANLPLFWHTFMLRLKKETLRCDKEVQR